MKSHKKRSGSVDKTEMTSFDVVAEQVHGGGAEDLKRVKISAQT